jgi:hypothetical protein
MRRRAWRETRPLRELAGAVANRGWAGGGVRGTAESQMELRSSAGLKRKYLELAERVKVNFGTGEGEGDGERGRDRERERERE